MSEHSCDDAVAGAVVVVRGLDGNRRGAIILTFGGGEDRESSAEGIHIWWG